MSNNTTFSVVSQTDQEYLDALKQIQADGSLECQQYHLGDIQVQARDLADNKMVQEVLAYGVRAFNRIHCSFPNSLSMEIKRSTGPEMLFDTVSVNGGQGPEPVAKLAAIAQKHLQTKSLLGIGSALGEEARQHFQAREIALAKLEKMAADLMQEMEEVRKRREDEYQSKVQTLENRVEKERQELQSQHEQRSKQLQEKADELDRQRKELDDRASKHARRQHYKDIKEKFKSWNDKFQVTKGTSHLRISVAVTTVFLLLLFGGLAAGFLFQSITASDNTHLIAAAVKQVTFTLLFVSTAFFFIRWNNQWFQRHADEEFRLKRMELDIDRASWFVEMAFEWKEEKGTEIPLAIIERLTQGLFANDVSDHSAEPADSLMQAIVGAARFKVQFPNGIMAEYDRKGIKELLRNQPVKGDGCD